MNGDASMSEAGDNAPISSSDGPSAGAMLRAAREKRGLHIAALAASIKVSPRKLEALEADRHAELPDLTFTRALAQTVCRALKIDAAPVLAKLPHVGDMPKLAQVGGGINAPFRATSGSRDPGAFSFHRRPVFWATLLVLAGALALALLPDAWMPWRIAGSLPVSAPVRSPAASAASTVLAPAAPPAAPAPGLVDLAPPAMPVAPSLAAAATPALIETVHSAPPTSLAGSADAAAGALALRTTAESWVDVLDGRGQSLLSRTLRPGETVGLDGTLPLRLTIGNAAVTQLSFRGQPVDLKPSTRDNIARLQLPPR